MSEDSSHSSDDSVASWIASFCQERQNQFFCEVERTFIEDGFNLYGLRPYVKHFKESLDIILDKNSHAEDEEAEQEEYQQNAELLYGLIHSRYIITMHGMETMCEKYQRKDFGVCPRVMCEGQAVLPVGTKDEPYQAVVRVFCPRCQQLYTPSVITRRQAVLSGAGYSGGRRQRQVFSSASSSASSTSSGGENSSTLILMDGAFIGTTFPHLFLMTFEDKVPPPARDVYIPRVFGFRLHTTNKSRVTPTLLPALHHITASTSSAAEAHRVPSKADGCDPPASGGGGAGKGVTASNAALSNEDSGGGVVSPAKHKRRRTEEES